MELKPRLAAITKFVPEGSVVVDVGTDHAYLPVFLVSKGICPRAVGTDIHEGPYRLALEQVKGSSLSTKIAVYLGNGLTPLEPGQADTAVIAGMGGTTIVDILAASPQVLAGIKRLVLQPMVAGAALRLWLLQNGWVIIDEQLVEEDKRIYEIIVAERGEQEVPEEVLLELGPCLTAKKDPLLNKVIKAKIQALEGVLKQLENAKNAEVADKKSEVKEKISKLREVLQ